MSIVNIDELIKLSSNIINFLINKQVDVIIIACGTVSSNCYRELSKKYSIPIYDIITPTLDFLRNSPYNKIGVIATTKTIESKIFDIKEKDIFMKDTPSFVPIIENNQINENEGVIKKELEYFKDNVESLVLGCTHYPMLSSVIKKYLDIPLINMGTCLSETINLESNSDLEIELYFSKLTDEIRKNIENVLERDYIIKEVC